ncbi:MAG: M1 family metallopeptidase [Novosphingobium sp.]|uniref:M1 family metallopeptidase n=1 Tax=Novosphingobium sp. TaxID=1874826 RepID=UPI0032B9B2C8
MRPHLIAASLLSLAIAGQVPAGTPAADGGTGAAAALAPVPPGKLSGAVRPKAYRIDIKVDPSRERFSGHVEIDAVLAKSSNFIDLHGRGLGMQRAVATVRGKTYIGRWFELDSSGVARLVFDRPLPAGPIKLSFDYDAPFQGSASGMFRVKVGDEWYSWTQFESIDARAAFPGFDEPGFKVPFTVTLRTRPGQMAVSNAPELSSRTEDGWQVHRFAPTLPLPTYLVAMMVGPFSSVSGTVPATPQRSRPLPVRIITTKQNAGQMTFALDGTKGIVKHLENYFGQGFPYPKLDQITSPIMPGAMENAGADLYSDPILIMDDKATTGQKRTFGMVVSHELAHQWFGDLVTPAWWDDIWLNESFANWMGFRIGDEWRPDLNIKAGALAEGFNAMGTDALVAGRAIHQPIATNAQIDEAFDTITYGKGGHVVAMIAGYMGDTKFRDGVRSYMAAHKNGSATSTDFFAAMAKVSGDPRIIPAMQSFTDQQGVPLVTFDPDGKGGYTVSQSRYARLGSTAPVTRWGIPLCLRASAGQRQCQLIDQASTAISVPGAGALIPNAGGTGYYRFELPAAEWDKLIALAGTLPGGEALAMDDSLFASFQAGRASAAQLLTSAEKLSHNPDSYASDAGIDSLARLFNAGMVSTESEAGYRRFVGAIYAPRLKAMGFDLQAGAYAAEDPEKSQLREQAVWRLAMTAREPAIRTELGKAASAYLAGNSMALDPAWFDAAFRILIEQGGVEAAKALAEQALTSQDPLFRPAALGAIGGSGNADVGRWVLNDFNDLRLRRSERFGLIGGVAGARETRDMAFDWVKAHAGELFGGNNGIFMASRLPQMVGGFCSAERADEIAALLRPQLQGKTGSLELERTIERVRSCGILKQARSAELSAVFAKVAS